VAHFRARAAALAARRGVEFLVDREEHHAAVPADPSAIDLLCRAVERSGHAPHRLTSGAGHDAAVMAASAPMAMLFLRSPGGVSHHPDESVRPEDVAVALDVMIRYLDLLADRVEYAGGVRDHADPPGGS
jgi:allantoate deiminase